jgi:hypothetical protein
MRRLCQRLCEDSIDSVLPIAKRVVEVVVLCARTKL